jgi:hypothetical protein
MVTFAALKVYFTTTKPTNFYFIYVNPSGVETWEYFRGPLPPAVSDVIILAL